MQGVVHNVTDTRTGGTNETMKGTTHMQGVFQNVSDTRKAVSNGTMKGTTYMQEVVQNESDTREALTCPFGACEMIGCLSNQCKSIENQLDSIEEGSKSPGWGVQWRL